MMEHSPWLKFSETGFTLKIACLNYQTKTK